MDEETTYIEQTIKDLPDKMKDLWSVINQIANLRYHFLLYKLLKKGRLNIGDLAEDSGLSKQRLYHIVDKIDKLLLNK